MLILNTYQFAIIFLAYVNVYCIDIEARSLRVASAHRVIYSKVFIYYQNMKTVQRTMAYDD